MNMPRPAECSVGAKKPRQIRALHVGSLTLPASPSGRPQGFNLRAWAFRAGFELFSGSGLGGRRVSSLSLDIRQRILRNLGP